MGVPAVSNYQLPREHEIPAAKVPWIPDSRRAALLVHDMQRYFMKVFTPGSAPIDPVVKNIERLIKHCRQASIPVFYTAQRGNQQRCDRGLQADFWGPGMQAIAEHEQIIEPLQPQPGDFELVKHRYSAFQRSNLHTLMQARGRDQLVVCGVYAQIGCLLTIAEAFQKDIEAFMVADAVAAYSREHHDTAIEYVAGCCGVCMTTDKVLAALSSGLTLEQMRADIAALLHEDPSEIALDDNLMDLGLDSLRAMNLLEKWSRQGVQLDFSRVAERPTLGGWWQLAQEAR